MLTFLLRDRLHLRAWCASVDEGEEMDIQVGDRVRSRDGWTGEVIQCHTLWGGIVRYVIRRDPVTNCLGQQFGLSPVACFPREIDKLMPIELLAEALSNGK